VCVQVCGSLCVAVCLCVGAVCISPPPSVTNGMFPSSCVGSAVGGSCTAKCNSGYAGGLNPVSRCELQSGTGVWATPDPGQCLKGTTKDGLAFILNSDANAVSGSMLRQHGLAQSSGVGLRTLPVQWLRHGSRVGGFSEAHPGASGKAAKAQPACMQGALHENARRLVTRCTSDVQ